MLDFIDLGSSTGSIQYSKKIFGGKEYLGININSLIVEECCKKGFNVIKGDITDLNIEKLPTCKYITSLHVLEHLENEEKVFEVIKTTSKIALDFIYFSIPNFDDDEKLKDFGLKFSWTSYKGHKTKLTSEKLKNIICDKLNLNAFFGKSILVKDSYDKEILPLTAPEDTIFYDKSLGIKKYIEFNNIYRENYVFINLREIEYFKELSKIKLWNK